MHFRPRLGHAGLLAAAVMLLGACSSGAATSAPTAAPRSAAATAAPIPPAPTGTPTAGGQTGTVDANGYLTPEVAASIIGGTPTRVAVPGNIGAGGMSLASYANPAGDNVTALVQPVPPGAGASMLQVAIQAAGAQGELQPLSGLGDAAGTVTGAHDATAAFTKGDILVVVYASAAAAAGTDLLARLETVARQIADKL